MDILKLSLKEKIKLFNASLDDNDELMEINYSLAILDELIQEDLLNDETYIPLLRSIYSETCESYHYLRWVMKDIFTNNCVLDLGKYPLGDIKSQIEIYILTGNLNVHYQYYQDAYKRYKKALSLVEDILKTSLDEENLMRYKEYEAELWAKLSLTSDDEKERRELFDKVEPAFASLDDNTYNFDIYNRLEATYAQIFTAYYYFKDYPLVERLIDNLYDYNYSWQEFELGDLFNYTKYKAIYVALNEEDIHSIDAIHFLVATIHNLMEVYRTMESKTILSYIKQLVDIVNTFENPKEKIDPNFFESVMEDANKLLNKKIDKIEA